MGEAAASQFETRELPTLHVRAAFQPETIDEEERTVEVVWSTGARVLRRPWFDEPYYEELDVRKADLSRLNNRAPVLDSHNGYTLKSQLGVVERAWVDKEGNGRAKLRFSKRAEVDPVWQDVRDGIVTHTSAGYVVERYLNVTQEEDKHKVLRAVEWTVYEISMVPMGADDPATTRSHENDNRYSVVIETTPEAMMGKKNENAEAQGTTSEGSTEGQRAQPAPAAPPAPAPVDEAKVREEAVAAERARANEIRTAARVAQLGDEFAEKLVSDGVSVDQARAAIIEEWAKRGTPAHQTARVEGGERDENLTRRDAMAAYLLHRRFPSIYKLEGAAVEYRGMALVDLARECLEVHGERTRGLKKMELVTRALHTTSDFPLLLENIATKTLRDSYEQAAQTFRVLGRQATLPDFKEISRVQLGEASKLLKIPEGSEFKYGTVGEAAEKYRLFTYGRALSLSREAIINDDLDGFTRIPHMLGAAAAELESDLVWDHILGNPEMHDGTVLFHSDHGNLGSAAAIGVAGLGLMRKAMRKQTGLDGKTLINVSPRFLVVSAGRETVAEQFLATQLFPEKGENVNPFAGRLQLVVEPRIDADDEKQWYGFADPARIDTFEFAYLEGESGPYIESREHFDVNGMAIKVRHDFGVKAIDWRGMYKNPGT